MLDHSHHNQAGYLALEPLPGQAPLKKESESWDRLSSAISHVVRLAED
jgi:hypothetical protein